jgi:hypothetical protein
VGLCFSLYLLLVPRMVGVLTGWLTSLPAFGAARGVHIPQSAAAQSPLEAMGVSASQVGKL